MLKRLLVGGLASYEEGRLLAQISASYGV